MAEFFAMGGYAAYVWPSYGAAALFLGALVISLVRRNAQVRRELSDLEAAKGLRKGSAPSGADGAFSGGEAGARASAENEAAS